MKKILLIVSVLFLAACSPQKQLARLLKKHPELLQKDTIYYKDTFFVPEIKLDTFFKINFDTIFFEKENLKIQLIKNDSIIYLKATKQTDTIFIEKKIPIEKIIYKKTFDIGFAEIFYFVVIFFFIIAVLSLIIKILKK